MVLVMKKVKWTGLDQRTVVSFVQVVPQKEGDTTKEVSTVDPFTITVSPSGISFKGSMVGELQEQKELQEFAKLIGDVWKERLSLRPKLVTSPSGH